MCIYGGTLTLLMSKLDTATAVAGIGRLIEISLMLQAGDDSRILEQSVPDICAVATVPHRLRTSDLSLLRGQVIYRVGPVLRQELHERVRAVNDPRVRAVICREMEHLRLHALP